MSFKAGICALRLGFELKGWEEEEKEEGGFERSAGPEGTDDLC